MAAPKKKIFRPRNLTTMEKVDRAQTGKKPKDRMPKPKSGGKPELITTKNKPGGPKTPGAKKKT